MSINYRRSGSRIVNVHFWQQVSSIITSNPFFLEIGYSLGELIFLKYWSTLLRHNFHLEGQYLNVLYILIDYIGTKSDRTAGF
jgi:hypothetical protein